MEMVMSDIDDIRSQLEALSEQLNDAAMRILSDAIESGQTNRPDAEKKVSQARRAVEKALHHLNEIKND